MSDEQEVEADRASSRGIWVQAPCNQGNSYARLRYRPLYEQLERESPAQRIQRALPYLEIEQIEEAIEYWRSHPEEIAEDIERDNAAYEELKSHR